MNNFDAYVVIRPNKAPKGFVFAVKSTDNITFFESTFDYVHTFSVPEREGENWLEKILLARVRPACLVVIDVTYPLLCSPILFTRNATLSWAVPAQAALVHLYLELALESVPRNLL